MEGLLPERPIVSGYHIWWPGPFEGVLVVVIVAPEGRSQDGGTVNARDISQGKGTEEMETSAELVELVGGEVIQGEESLHQVLVVFSKERGGAMWGHNADLVVPAILPSIFHPSPSGAQVESSGVVRCNVVGEAQVQLESLVASIEELSCEGVAVALVEKNFEVSEVHFIEWVHYVQALVEQRAETNVLGEFLGNTTPAESRVENCGHNVIPLCSVEGDGWHGVPEGGHDDVMEGVPSIRLVEARFGDPGSVGLRFVQEIGMFALPASVELKGDTQSDLGLVGLDAVERNAFVGTCGRFSDGEFSWDLRLGHVTPGCACPDEVDNTTEGLVSPWIDPPPGSSEEGLPRID